MMENHTIITNKISTSIFLAGVAALTLHGCDTSSSGSGSGDSGADAAGLTKTSNDYVEPQVRAAGQFSTHVNLWGLSSSTIDIWFKNKGTENDKMTVLFDTGSNPFFVLGKTGMGYSQTRDIYEGKCEPVSGKDGKPIYQSMSYADGSGFDSELCGPSSTTIQIQNREGEYIDANPAFYQIVNPKGADGVTDAEAEALLGKTKKVFS